MSAFQSAPRRSRETRRGLQEASNSAPQVYANKYADHLDNLRSAREETLALLSAKLHDKGPSWIALLKPAAKHLLSVFEQLLGDSHLWDELKRSEVATAYISEEEARLLAETMDTDLAGLLDFMKYKPPPSSAEMASELQLSLHNVLSQPNRAARAGLTRDAYRSLYFYTYRLQYLLNQIDKSSESDLDNRLTWREIAAALKKGALAAGPPIIAVGATAALFPPAGIAGLAGAFGAGATAAARELAQRGAQAAATGVLSKLLADEETMADPVTARFATATKLEVVAIDLISELNDFLDGPAAELPDTIRALGIQAMCTLYEILRAQSAVDDGRDAFVQSPVQDALRALRDLRDCAQTPSRAELVKIAQIFGTATAEICKKLTSGPA